MIQVDIKRNGKIVHTVTLDTRDKNNPFKTGSIGYHGSGKITIDGKEYQTGILLTQIGTKGKYN